MNSDKAKKRLAKLLAEAKKLQKEAEKHDVPWSVPYEFSAFFNDCEEQNRREIEKIWNNDENQLKRY